MNNKTNIKEDIHMLMQIRNIFEHLKNYGWINDIKREIDPCKAVQAIENILADRERLEKENNKLTYARDWYFENTVNKVVTPEMLHKILRTKYISKEDIKELQAKANKYDSLVEKIEDKLVEEKEDMHFAKRGDRVELHTHTREVLKELLEEK